VNGITVSKYYNASATNKDHQQTGWLSHFLVSFPRSWSWTLQDGVGGSFRVNPSRSLRYPGSERRKQVSLSTLFSWRKVTLQKNSNIQVKPLSRFNQVRHVRLSTIFRDRGGVSRRLNPASCGLALPSLRQARRLGGWLRTSPLPFRNSSLTPSSRLTMLRSNDAPPACPGVGLPVFTIRPFHYHASWRTILSPAFLAQVHPFVRRKLFIFK
jgi:hypothetical protein